MVGVIMVNVVMLNVIMQSMVAPLALPSNNRQGWKGHDIGIHSSLLRY